MVRALERWGTFAIFAIFEIFLIRLGIYFLCEVSEELFLWEVPRRTPLVMVKRRKLRASHKFEHKFPLPAVPRRFLAAGILLTDC